MATAKDWDDAIENAKYRLDDDELSRDEWSDICSLIDRYKHGERTDELLEALEDLY